MNDNRIVEEQITAWYNCWFRLRGAYQLWSDKEGITYNTLFVLYEINKHPEGCTQKQICDALVLSKQTVSAILKKLESDEYISRETHLKDKRNNQVCFTEKGSAYAKPILARMFELEKEAYASVENYKITEIIQGGTELATALEKSFQIR